MPFCFSFTSFHLSLPFCNLLIITAHFSSFSIRGIPTISVIESIPNVFSSQNDFMQAAHLQTSTEPIVLSSMLMLTGARYVI